MMKGVCKNCDAEGKVCKGCYKKMHMVALVILTIVAFTVGALVGAKAGMEKAAFKQDQANLQSLKQQEVLVNELNKERGEANAATETIQKIQDIIGGITEEVEEIAGEEAAE